MGFEDLFNQLGIEYKKKGESLITGEAIVSLKKRLFIWKETQKGGNVIQFIADKMNIPHREAAAWLEKTFLRGKEPIREIPELELNYAKEVEALGITEDLANNFEIGLVKQRSVLAGHVAFKIYNERGDKIGYIGLKKGKWLFPKAFQRDFLYNLNRAAKNDYVIVVPSVLEVVYLASLGITYSVSTVGKSATDAQISLLGRFKRILLFGFDNDSLVVRLSAASFVKSAEMPVMNQPLPSIKQYF